MNERRFSVGKLPMDVLAKHLGTLHDPTSRVLVGPRVGEDAAVIEFGDTLLVAKTDPITFATDEIGWYAVNINANDIATMGATPQWFLATVLLPEKDASEVLMATIFEQLRSACNALGIALVGGHTEITYDLSRPIVVGQMLGEVARDRLVTTAGAQVGDRILLTKGIAIEGTAIVAREKKAELLSFGVDEAVLRRAATFLRDPGVSVVRDARLACEAGEVHSMHDPTEGGVATGLLEMASAAGVGLRIALEAIPVLPESAQLLPLFDLDPLGVIASGCLLLAVPPESAPAITAALEREGVACADVGEATRPEEGLAATIAGRPTPFPRFEVDEIARLF